MYRTTPTIEKILFIISGIPFAFGSVLFAYYTVWLIHLNMTIEGAASYRTGVMLIAAVGFPLAAIIFGFISWFFIKKARSEPLA